MRSYHLLGQQSAFLTSTALAQKYYLEHQDENAFQNLLTGPDLFHGVLPILSPRNFTLGLWECTVRHLYLIAGP